ncbi:malate dehydrogenase [Bienertia sinuspersici]
MLCYGSKHPLPVMEGLGCLEKLTKIKGRFIEVDHATTNRDKLVFARCMVEVKVGQSFPEQICFLNETDQKRAVPITCEWRTIQFTNYKSIVRFNSMENRDKVMNMDRLFFDSKPVVLKPWHLDIDVTQDEIKRIPI